MYITYSVLPGSRLSRLLPYVHTHLACLGRLFSTVDRSVCVCIEGVELEVVVRLRRRKDLQQQWRSSGRFSLEEVERRRRRRQQRERQTILSNLRLAASITITKCLAVYLHVRDMQENFFRRRIMGAKQSKSIRLGLL